MSVIPFALRNELIASLKSIESETGKVFLGLGETLPALVKEMNRSLERSESTLGCMNGTDGTGCSDGVDVGALVSRTRSIMDTGSQEFRKLSNGYTTLFTDLQENIGTLETIASSIATIKLDSEDMEIVSLNAMTVALKAGTAGRAFSYITEELKRLATRTIALSEQISDRGAELISSFRTFENTLQEARSFQSQLFDNFQSRIGQSFEEFQLAVETTISGLEELRQRSMDLKRPINGMMEAIQLQDLIRQSIDHIILALEAIKPEEELQDDETLLDELSFLRSIPELAATLIDDVASQIEESATTFRQLTEDAESRLEALDRDRKEFIDGRIHLQGGREVNLTEVFEAAALLMNDLLGDLEANIANKASLVTRSATITDNVSQLEDQFKQFDTLVTRFHNVDIASRIEVAKQETLRRMGTSSEQMTRLTAQIERDVDTSLSTTRAFIASTEAIISRYQEQYQHEAEFVSRFSRDLTAAHAALTEGRLRVTETVSGFSLFTGGFYQVFSTNSENGRRLSGLADSIRGLKEGLAAMMEAIDDRYRKSLAARGLERWEISSDRLREIIERFTIFAHKKHAGDIAGFDVDNSVEAGDVTLF